MKLKIEVSIHEIDALVEKLTNFPRRELLQIIANKSAEQVERRIFEEKTTPGGARWESWSPRYAKTRKGGNSLLYGTGALLQSITGQVLDDKQAVVSSNLPYAARQHFGGGGIPARPYMGLSQDNIDEINGVVEAWLQSYLK